MHMGGMTILFFNVRSLILNSVNNFCTFSPSSYFYYYSQFICFVTKIFTTFGWVPYFLGHMHLIKKKIKENHPTFGSI